jgi:hypothetical protein
MGPGAFTQVYPHILELLLREQGGLSSEQFFASLGLAVEPQP